MSPAENTNKKIRAGWRDHLRFPYILCLFVLDLSGDLCLVGDPNNRGLWAATEEDAASLENCSFEEGTWVLFQTWQQGQPKHLCILHAEQSINPLKDIFNERNLFCYADPAIRACFSLTNSNFILLCSSSVVLMANIIVMNSTNSFTIVSSIH